MKLAIFWNISMNSVRLSEARLNGMSVKRLTKTDHLPYSCVTCPEVHGSTSRIQIHPLASPVHDEQVNVTYHIEACPTATLQH